MIVLCIVVTSGHSSSAATLFPNPAFRVGDSPRSVAVGDFNADGVQDLAVVNSTSDDVSILLGLGDGSFGPQSRFVVGDQPRSVAIGDFNADGAQDLAVGNSGVFPFNPGHVSVLLGLGDGTFGPQSSFVVGAQPWSVAVGDFNADGAQDLAVANHTSADVSILLGLGDGTFGPQSSFGAGVYPSSVVVADFNADGTQDLAVANSISSDVSILLGLGDGTFGPENRVGVGDSPRSVAVGDFNADGVQDLAVANDYSDDVSILLGLGDGTFGPQSSFGVGRGSGSVAVGDFDADGVQDLAVTSTGVGLSQPGHVSVLLGLGDGTFGPENRFGAGIKPISVAIGDFNADGAQDLVVPNFSTDDVSILLGLGDGCFGPQSRFVVGDQPSSVAVGDFNADGVQDLAVVNAGSGDVSMLLGLGDGTFGPQSRFAVGDHLFFVAAGDFNADGVPDLVVPNSGSDEGSILLGLGDGTFGPQSRFAVGDHSSFVAVGDFNADGAQDLAVPNGRSDDVLILLGFGDGTFGPQSRFGAGIGPSAVAVGDFDVDGAQDLAVVNPGLFPNPGHVSVLLGLGDGTFGPQSSFLVGDLPRSVAVGDFNADGAQDLAVANFNSHDISIRLGLGDGTFGPQSRFGAGPRPRFVAVGDFDADGVQDLAVANPGSNLVSILLGLGDGTFGPENRFRAGSDPRSIAVGEFNADGRQDLAVPNGPTDDVSILLNQGPFPNEPPVAMASADAAAECTSPGGAQVVLNGSASADPDSSPGTNDDIVLFEWFRDLELPTQVSLGFGEILSVTLPLGTHSVTLRVLDSQGESDTDTVSVNVVDRTPPVISATLAPSLLWPPNHRMVDIDALVSASDLCSTPALHLVSVASDEPDNAAGMGDGNTVNDIQGAAAATADSQFQLRAERAGTGGGRTYTVTYSATDGSGNVGIATAFAFVPHNVEGQTEPLPITAYENGTGTVVQWLDVPGTLFYNAVRGKVSNLRDKLDFFHLGQLTCITSVTTQTSTLGSEDTELPSPGEAFFYLVEYNDGLSSGYGTESAAKQRFVPPGQGSCP